jgi:hypothetical protein
MELGIVRLELVVRVIPRSTRLARVVRILKVLDQGIIAGEVCLESTEDADVVPFGEPGVVVFGGCGAEIAIAACARSVSCALAHGGFRGLVLVVCKKRREEDEEEELKSNAGLKLIDRVPFFFSLRLRSSVHRLRVEEQ